MNRPEGKRKTVAEENAQENRVGQFVKSIPGKLVHRQKAVFGVVVAAAACLVLAVGAYGGSVTFGAQTRNDMEMSASYMNEAQYAEALTALQDVIAVDEKKTEIAIDAVAVVEAEAEPATAEMAVEDVDNGQQDTSSGSSSSGHSNAGTSGTGASDSRQTVSDSVIDEDTIQTFLETFSGSMFLALEDWFANGDSYDGTMGDGQAYSVAALSLIEQEREDVYGSGVATFCFLNGEMVPVDENASGVEFLSADEEEDVEWYVSLEGERLQDYEQILEDMFAGEYSLDAFCEFESEAYGQVIRKEENGEEDRFYLKVLSEEDVPQSEAVSVTVGEIPSELNADGTVTVAVTYSRAINANNDADDDAGVDEYCVWCHMVPDETATNGCYVKKFEFEKTEKNPDQLPDPEEPEDVEDAVDEIEAVEDSNQNRREILRWFARE